MKPDIPSPPCPAPTAAKACFSSHKRCTIERLSLSLFRSPSFFYFSLVLILPVGKARCQPLPKAGHSALTLYSNASTHTFILFATASPSPPLLYLFISPLTLQSLQHFFPFLYSVLLLHFYHASLWFFAASPYHFS